jgi:hypothetical protein
MYSGGPTESKQTSVVLSPSARLPDICYQCGSATDRRVTVQRRIAGTTSATVWLLATSTAVLLILGLVLSRLFWLIALATGAASAAPAAARRADVLRLKIPQCQSCAVNGRPAPLSMDTERLTMTFVVDRQFASRL